MSFFLSALPALFSSPFVRDTLGSIAGGIWNSIKSNAAVAANDFVNNTVQQGATAIRNSVQGISGKRVYPFDDGTDDMDWTNENPDPNPDPPFTRDQRRRPLGRKKVKR